MPHLAKAKVVTRPLNAYEVHHATDWAIQEGWNPGASDASIFNVADPGSLITAEVDGRPVGVVSAVRMTPDFGFLGFFVLPPEHRGSIYGWTLWNTGMARLGDRVMGGDGILSRLRSYAHYGFAPHYYTVSYNGVAPSRPREWRRGVELASNTSLAKLAAYDAAGFGVSRAAFLAEWLTLPDSLSLTVKRDGQLCGIGTVRRCHHGVRIGPLQADDLEAAEALFDALVGLAPGEPLAIDCPENNPDATKLTRKKGLAPGSKTARLYRGKPLEGIPGRIYGQMSFALG